MSEPTDVDLAVLRGWPLPEPGSNKQARGVVLMVGGSAGVPGAMVLAGEASLRAGAGKLQVVTTGSVAGQMAVSIPEALAVAEAIGAERTYLTHLTHKYSHAELEARLPPNVRPAHDGLTIEV